MKFANYGVHFYFFRHIDVINITVGIFRDAKIIKIFVKMKASDIISAQSVSKGALPQRNVPADTMAVDILPLLLDAPDRQIGVTDGSKLLGVIDERSMLEGLGRLIVPRDDSSIVVLDIAPSAYSASAISHAVEDADTHLVDLWSAPGTEGNLRVTLRVRCADPSGVVASLERYGFAVADVSSTDYHDAEVAMERLLSLQAILNV